MNGEWNSDGHKPQALHNHTVRGGRLRVLIGLPDGWPGELPDPTEIPVRILPTSAPHHMVLRVDNSLVLALWLKDDQSPILIEHHQTNAPDLYSRWLTQIDRLWDQSTPLKPTEGPAPATGPDPEPASAGDEPPRRWPGRTN